MNNKKLTPIKGFCGYFFDSNYNIVSTKRNNQTILKPYINRNGYKEISLRKEGKSKNYRVHRLLMLTFSQNPKRLPCINHKNGIKTDNRLSNLEWVTYSYNNKHAFEMGLNKANGENNNNSILKESQVLEIKQLLRDGYTQKSIAKEYKISRRNVSSIKCGRTWKHV